MRDGSRPKSPALVADLEPPFSDVVMLERLRAWPNGLLPGAAELVRSLGGIVETAVLSNTSALHWETQTDHETIQALFRRPYLSYELGTTKPDVEISEYVIADLGVATEAILFLDDDQANVDGARMTGMKAHRCDGVAEAEAILRSYRVVPERERALGPSLASRDAPIARAVPRG